MAVIRRVTLKNKLTKPKIDEVESSGGKQITPGRSKKICWYCKSNIQPAYWDVLSLKKYISDRGRITSRQRSGVCSKHQRKLACEIKRARHLSLVPFVVRI